MAIDTSGTHRDSGSRPDRLGSGAVRPLPGVRRRHLRTRPGRPERAGLGTRARCSAPFGGNRSPLGLAALKAQDANWSAAGRRRASDGPRVHRAVSACRWPRPTCWPTACTSNTEVVALGRDGLLKDELAGDPERGETDFRLLLRSTRPQDHGRERLATADVVIDCTGTYGNHNWMGHGGIPAIGELAAADRTSNTDYADVLGAAARSLCRPADPAGRRRRLRPPPTWSRWRS